MDWPQAKDSMAMWPVAPEPDSTALDHQGSGGTPAPDRCDDLSFASPDSTRDKEKCPQLRDPGSDIEADNRDEPEHHAKWKSQTQKDN